MRALWALLLLASASISYAQQTGGNGVPGAATAGTLPTASAAGQAPVSTGAGTTYTAQAVPTVTTETVTYSATPTFSSSTSYSRIVLTGNITSFTLAAGSGGQRKCIDFVQGAGSYTIAGPANVHNLFTIGLTSADNNIQCYAYDATAVAWLAESAGSINQ